MARKAAGGRKGRGKEQEVEVVEVEAEEAAAPAKPAGIENGLVFVTFAALAAALVLLNLKMSSDFGIPWPF